MPGGVRSNWIAHAGLALTFALAIGMVLLSSIHRTEPLDVWRAWPDLLMGCSFGAVGWVVARKRPDNPIGWCLFGSGLGLFGGNFLGVYAEFGLLQEPSLGLPATRIAETISDASWTVFMGFNLLLILLFPAGRFASKRWQRLALVAGGLLVVVTSLIMVSPSNYDPPLDAYANPLGIAGADKLIPLLVVSLLCLLVCFLSAAVALLLRFRRAAGDERQQFKWLALSVGVVLVLLPINALINVFSVGGVISDVADLGFVLGIAGIPLSVGLAVMKYRLYDIDWIVNRTVVYVVLSAALVVVYLAIALGSQEAMRGRLDAAAPLLAAGVVAIAFRPTAGVSAVRDRPLDVRPAAQPVRGRLQPVATVGGAGAAGRRAANVVRDHRHGVAAALRGDRAQ